MTFHRALQEKKALIIRTLHVVMEKMEKKYGPLGREIAWTLGLVVRFEKQNCIIKGPSGMGKSFFVEQFCKIFQKLLAAKEIKFRWGKIDNTTYPTLLGSAEYATKKDKNGSETFVDFIMPAVLQHDLLFIDDLTAMMKKRNAQEVVSIFNPLISESTARKISRLNFPLTETSQKIVDVHNIIYPDDELKVGDGTLSFVFRGSVVACGIPNSPTWERIPDDFFTRFRTLNFTFDDAAEYFEFVILHGPAKDFQIPDRWKDELLSIFPKKLKNLRNLRDFMITAENRKDMYDLEWDNDELLGNTIDEFMATVLHRGKQDQRKEMQEWLMKTRPKVVEEQLPRSTVYGIKKRIEKADEKPEEIPDDAWKEMQKEKKLIIDRAKKAFDSIFNGKGNIMDVVRSKLPKIEEPQEPSFGDMYDMEDVASEDHT